MRTAPTTALLLAVLCATGLNSGMTLAADGAQDAAATVAAFNAALSERNLDKTIAHLLDGGAQFNLQPAHTGLGAPQGIASSLRAHWSTIAPVLFAATKSYSRKAQVVHARADNGMATVWTNTTTESVRPDKPGASKASFTEVYLLVLKDNEWKIGAIADSRRPNDVGFSGGQP